MKNKNLFQCPTCRHLMTEDESKGYNGCPTGLHPVQHKRVSAIGEIKKLSKQLDEAKALLVTYRMGNVNRSALSKGKKLISEACRQIATQEVNRRMDDTALEPSAAISLNDEALTKMEYALERCLAVSGALAMKAGVRGDIEEALAAFKSAKGSLVS